MIEVKNLTLSYEENKALDNVSCSFPQGRITILLGHSGSGKTSLLSTVMQLKQNAQGVILCDGSNIADLPRKQKVQYIGFVFQTFNLFENMTVLQNCINPQVVVTGMTVQDAQEIAQEVLKKIGISDLQDRFPSQLSQGQQQRAAIARALCFSPKVLLLDEPSSGLDPYSGRVLTDILRSLADDGIAVVVATHDMDFVRRSLDRIYFLKKGKIIESYDKEVNGDLDGFTQITSFLNREHK